MNEDQTNSTLNLLKSVNAKLPSPLKNNDLKNIDTTVAIPRAKYFHLEERIWEEVGTYPMADT